MVNDKVLCSKRGTTGRGYLGSLLPHTKLFCGVQSLSQELKSPNQEIKLLSPSSACSSCLMRGGGGNKDTICMSNHLLLCPNGRDEKSVCSLLQRQDENLDQTAKVTVTALRARREDL